MYQPEEVHLAKQVEYEYQDMANNVDDLKFMRPRQENLIKIAFVRARKSISPRLSIIAGILSITMLLVLLMLLTIHVKQHKGKVGGIIAGNNFPGINFYPQVNKNQLIKFNTFTEASYRPYTEYIEHILEEYTGVYINNSYLDDCDVPDLHLLNRTCVFWRQQLGNCIHLQHYGYAEGRPCVLLSLDLPENIVPLPLENSNPLVKQHLADRWSKDHVPVTCNGETENDTKFLIRPDEIFNESVTYSPLKGYSLNFFPRTGDLYRAPLVMVQFNTLQPGALINIQCTVWANYRNATLAIQSTTKFQIYMN